MKALIIFKIREAILYEGLVFDWIIELRSANACTELIKSDIE